MEKRRSLSRAATGLLALTLAVLLGNSCQPKPKIFLDSPIHGTFTNAGSVLVTGHVTHPNSVKIADVRVNGVSVLPLVGGVFEAVVALDPSVVFNPIEAELEYKSGRILRERVTLVVGDGIDTGFVLDGDASLSSVALRIGDTGLTQISPLVEELAGDSLDIGDLITAQNPVADDCIEILGGCAWFYQANAVEVTFGGFALDADTSAAGVVDTTITIDDFFIEVDLNVQDLAALDVSCTIEIEADSTTITGSFDLEPDATDPAFVDVNLLGDVGFAISGFDSTFVSGICDDPILGDIVQLIIGPAQIQQLMSDGFAANLNDPDGAGPLDSPLADAIETALAGISIAGEVGNAIMVDLDADFVSIDEDADGITMEVDAAMTATGLAPGAPDLPASYTVEEPFPSFGTTTPVGALPYGLAFGIGTSAMNQLLKSQIEGGLLQLDIDELDISGGGAFLPVTVSVLALFVPKLLDVYAPSTPGIIEIRPTLAPVLTGNPGPGGELVELRVAALSVAMRVLPTDDLALGLEVDLVAGVDLDFVDGQLAFALSNLDPAAITLAIVDNPYQSNESGLQTFFPTLFPFFAPALEGALGAFPVPAFLGLELDVVEVSRVGDFLGLFTNLTSVPTTTLQNFTVTDLSSGDYRSGGGCFMNEWRHRVSSQGNAKALGANLKGMLGADSGCTLNDQTADATASYRLDFDVAAVPGEQWTLTVDHSILGAFTLLDESSIFGDGGEEASIGAVSASWALGSGGSGSFGFAPSPAGVSHGIGGGEGDSNVEFGGSGGVVLGGTDSTSVQLTFSVPLHTFSNSNGAFPAIDGGEAAIRLGKNDTIDANFSAGEYPGVGSRNIAADGHAVSVSLSSVVLP